MISEYQISKVPIKFRLTRDWRYFLEIPAAQVISAKARDMQQSWCTFSDAQFKALQEIAARQQAERAELNRKRGIAEA
jgi:hypothetical protein